MTTPVFTHCAGRASGRPVVIHVLKKDAGVLGLAALEGSERWGWEEGVR